jgi:hypothetical protein
MGQRLKRWESPRREGRNDKGKGGSARQRQLKKRQQMLRQKLQDNSNNADKGRDFIKKSLLFLWNSYLRVNRDRNKTYSIFLFNLNRLRT